MLTFCRDSHGTEVKLKHVLSRSLSFTGGIPLAAFCAQGAAIPGRCGAVQGAASLNLMPGLKLAATS